ncbi:MAG TPA: 8-oxo-dGTP diphosphatase [Glycomyces sp.]|nr:8-oxo-dGTP diphosphatase [Glycomyces sp.]
MTSTPMSLCFLFRTGPAGRREVLLGRKKRGFGTGKTVGLGGKLEPGEIAVAAAAREIGEECGILVQAADLREAADIEFRFPHRPEWDMRVAVFTGERFTGEARETAEIAPRWYGVDDLPHLELWDDNRYWLPQVLAGRRLRAVFVYAEDGETVATAQVEAMQIEDARGELEHD